MKRWQVDSILLLIVMIWGSTFFLVRGATQQWPPIAFVAVRFGLAALAMLPWVVPTMRRWHWGELRAGLLLGLLLLVGFVAQTIGLSQISASRAGFITGLNVVIVPLLGALLWRTRVALQVWLGVALSVWGMFLLSRGDVSQAASRWSGDAWVLVCALFFAAHIVAIGRVTQANSVVALNFIQMLVVSGGAALLSLVVEPTPPTLTMGVLGPLLYLGIIATAFTLAIQIKVQRYASPTHTALVFVLEPVFAALFAALFINEALSFSLLSGGAFMIAGIILAELPPLRLAIKREPLA